MNIPLPNEPLARFFRCQMVDLHKMHMENYIGKAKTQAHILNDAPSREAVLERTCP